MGSEGSGVSKSNMAPGGEIRQAQTQGNNQSAIIGDLLSRGNRSCLPTGPYAEVAMAVIEANEGPARAELRVARVKAEAQGDKLAAHASRPSLSLTDLGETFASLLIEQVLFDGGGRKAERAFAAADVEFAATTLAPRISTNGFLKGLAITSARSGRSNRPALPDAALGRMGEFERIVGIRLEGGMSDRSEQRIIQQKAAEMRARPMMTASRRSRPWPSLPP